MADYEKLTVVNLRNLLKDRGIPSTGLTRKAQIIAKLQEHDELDAADDAASAPEPDEEPDEPPQPSPPAEPASPGPPLQTPAQAPAQAPAQPEVEPVGDVAPVNEAGPTVTQEQPAKFETDDAGASHTGGPPDPKEVAAKPIPVDAPKATTPEPQQADVVSQSAQLSNSQVLSTTESKSTQNLPSQGPPTDVEEFAEDMKKRKRRSKSPPPDSHEVAIKKARHHEPDMRLNEDDVMSDPVQPVPLGETQSADTATTPPKETAKPPVKSDRTDVTPGEPKQSLPEPSDSTQEVPPPSTEPESPRREKQSPKASRFNTLLQPGTTTMPQAPILDDLPTPPPSIHPATRALYIRNFQRPLQPTNLRKHIALLATAPGSSPNADIVETLHIDPIRTHTFVVLPTPSAAARVRAGMHDQVWPKERDRKPLWADYVPADLVPGWIEREMQAGSGGRPGGKRWEVAYTDDGEGNVVAELQEVGSQGTAGRQPSRAAPPPTDSRSDRREVPTSPRLSRRGMEVLDAPRGPAAARPQPADTSKSFLTLDKLFHSTRAKPMLYYLPAKEGVAAARRRELREATSRRWSVRDWRDGDELRRYTFEEESRLVDSGPHSMGPKARAREEAKLGYATAPRGPAGRGRRWGDRYAR